MANILILLIPIVLINLFLFSIYFAKKLSQRPKKPPTPTPETSAPETPAQKTETKSYAGTAIKVVATIAIAIIIFCAGFAGYNHFFSDDSSGKNSQKTANAENIVTVRVYANGYTCAVTPFFEKGQTIVITATGSVTGTTNRNKANYGYVDPTGWQNDPNLYGSKKNQPDKPYMALLGAFETKPGNWPYPFYIGREISIKAERTGTEKILFIPNKIKGKDGGGYFTVTIRIV